MRTVFRIQSSDTLSAEVNKDQSISVCVETEPMPEIDMRVVDIDEVLKAYDVGIETRYGISREIHNIITKGMAMEVIKEHFRMT
jgi:hypothetical protein